MTNLERIIFRQHMLIEQRARQMGTEQACFAVFGIAEEIDPCALEWQELERQRMQTSKESQY